MIAIFVLSLTGLSGSIVSEVEAANYSTLTTGKYLITSLTVQNYNGVKNTYVDGTKYYLNGTSNGYVASSTGSITFRLFNPGANPDTDEPRYSGKVDFTGANWKYTTYEHKTSKITLRSTSGTGNFDLQQIFSLPHTLDKDGVGKFTMIVNFYDGTYDAYGPFRIYGNTTIKSAGGNTGVTIRKCNFKNGISGSFKDSPLFVNFDDAKVGCTAYTCSSNIHFKNLTFDLMNDSSTCIIQATHASKINVTSCNFKNGSAAKKRHVIELNAMSDCTISGCTFTSLNKNLPATPGDLLYNEAIQIECDSDARRSKDELVKPDVVQGCLNFNTIRTSHDGTPSKNVTVIGCTFNGVIRAIGGHMKYVTSGKEMTGIVIKNNKISNASDYGVFFHYTKGLVLSGNTYSNINGKANYSVDAKNINPSITDPLH